MVIRLLIVSLLLICTTIQQECSQSWLTDGNYYDLNECINRCGYYNQQENATAPTNQTIACCTPICQREVSYHTAKRIVIIVIASSLFLLVFFCFFYGCQGPSLKKWYVLKQQKKKRPYVQMDVQEFKKFKKQFHQIFSQQKKDQWQITFQKDGVVKPMQWHYIKMRKIKGNDLQFRVNLEGQDSFGLWTSTGYFLSSPKGPMIWGLKDYQNAQNTTFYFQKLSNIVHELVRKENGEYEGYWYSRHNPDEKHVCSVKRRSRIKENSQRRSEKFQFENQYLIEKNSNKRD